MEWPIYLILSSFDRKQRLTHIMPMLREVLSTRVAIINIRTRADKAKMLGMLQDIRPMDMAKVLMMATIPATMILIPNMDMPAMLFKLPMVLTKLASLTKSTRMDLL